MTLDSKTKKKLPNKQAKDAEKAARLLVCHLDDLIACCNYWQDRWNPLIQPHPTDDKGEIEILAYKAIVTLIAMNLDPEVDKAKEIINSVTPFLPVVPAMLGLGRTHDGKSNVAGSLLPAIVNLYNEVTTSYLFYDRAELMHEVECRFPKGFAYQEQNQILNWIKKSPDALTRIAAWLLYWPDQVRSLEYMLSPFWLYPMIVDLEPLVQRELKLAQEGQVPPPVSGSLQDVRRAPSPVSSQNILVGTLTLTPTETATPDPLSTQIAQMYAIPTASPIAPDPAATQVAQMYATATPEPTITPFYTHTLPPDPIATQIALTYSTPSPSVSATSVPSVVNSPIPTPTQNSEFRIQNSPTPSRIRALTSGSGLSRYYYHANRLYNVVALTDDAGNVVERYRYNAYGLCTTFDANYENPMEFSRLGNPFTFTGRELDPETEFMHYRARAYLPRQGRFAQTDPIGYGSGINLYEYVNGFSVGLIDPMGLQTTQPSVEDEDIVYNPTFNDWSDFTLVNKIPGNSKRRIAAKIEAVINWDGAFNNPPNCVQMQKCECDKKLLDSDAEVTTNMTKDVSSTTMVQFCQSTIDGNKTNIRAGVIRNKSFVLSDLVVRADTLLLLHEQGHFKIAAIFASQYNRYLHKSSTRADVCAKDIMTGKDAADDGLSELIKRKRKEYFNNYDSFNSKYENETDHHLNKDKQREWNGRLLDMEFNNKFENLKAGL